MAAKKKTKTTRNKRTTKAPARKKSTRKKTPRKATCKTAGQKAAPHTVAPPIDDDELQAVERRFAESNLRSRKLQRYVVLLLSGTKREKALREAGYHPKNRRNARSMARRLENYLVDKGVLREALAHAGVNQLTIADAMAEVFDSDDLKLKVRASEILGRWLDYDKKQDEETDPAAAALDFNTVDQLQGLVTAELERRRTGGAEPPA